MNFSMYTIHINKQSEGTVPFGTVPDFFDVLLILINQ